MSKGYDRIQAILEAAGEQPENEYKVMQEIMDVYDEEGRPDDCKEQYGIAAGYVGQCFYYGWDVEKDLNKAFKPLFQAYLAGNKHILEELGMCHFNGWGAPKDEIMASVMWHEGMELGDKACALHHYVWEVENDRADEKTVAGLEALVNDPEKPSADACAVLYQYYKNIGDEANAALWCDKGLEMGSEIMRDLCADGKYVIIADVDDGFNIVPADASDWGSLPELIDAESCDDMRCEKFRRVSKELGLPGTLLGKLDRDAFRKTDLEPNWHASQWYDGMADLYGDMIICMEDSNYHPFSFSSEEEAQKAIDGLVN
ncbi:MAG: sel1 repeat family protein [Bacteroidales bacterium]|nr:sel1 repeat family protein [Bacteroidales bacterium]